MKRILLTGLFASYVLASHAAPVTIEVTDNAAVTAAREAYNASLPPIVTGTPPNVVTTPNPAAIPTNAAYLQMVVTRAVESWARQHKTNLAELDKEISALQAKRTKAIAAGAK